MKRSNPKAFEQMNVHLQALEGAESKVGWFSTARYPNGTPVAYVASIQELGCPEQKIPPRPFMRPTSIEKNKEWADTAAFAAKKVLAGEFTAHDAMDLLGLKAEGDVTKMIESITSPPLSPLTLAARKYRQDGGTVTGKTLGLLQKKLDNNEIDISGVSTKPLDDTGLMIATLTHVTETK